jgi:mono/diheme cytochrome c family protein
LRVATHFIYSLDLQILSEIGKIMIRWTSFCSFLIVAALPLQGQAGQVRPVTERVYSAGQAARGQEIYKAQCAECHGNAMEGTSGPPLVGDAFLANWSARPLTNIVDKIQKTMPFTSPGSLSRQQAIDLAAYILQSGKFPAGNADLSEGALAQIVFPTARPIAAPVVASGGGSLPPPEGNLAELMRAIAFPNANIIFNTQLKDPGAEKKKELAKSPFDYVEWGATVYPGWLAIDQAAVALTESAPLLLTPGRRCQNGRPVPVDRADWKQYVGALVDVGKMAHQVSKTRNYDAFMEISEKLNDACANCHKVYRDKGGAEGSGATRCQ